MSDDQSESTELPGQVIDYPARDMTITVAAAMTVGCLHDVLKRENQQLPIDAGNDGISISDLVAFDINGPRRYGYGTLRDYVIGMEAIDGKGRVFHAGGRVVKNVAGYDLCRLLIGAEGKLGTLRHLTFKLKPLPAETHLSIAAFRTLMDLDAALVRINLSSTTPVILDVVNHGAAEKLLPAIDSSMTPETLSGAEAFLVLGFDGSRKACDWQTKMIAEELRGMAGSITSVAGPQVMEDYCRTAMEFSETAKNRAKYGWVQVVTSPSQVVAVMQIAKDSGLSVCGRAGNGILYMPLDSADETGKVRDCLTKLVDGGAGYLEIREQNSIWRHPVTTGLVERYSKLLHELLG